jgi:phosphoribosyl 1,2-cyclic phosphate phosphodiesterase
MRGELLFLGTASSLGVPRLACSCKVCTDSSSFNKRMRCAALVLIDGKKILIDAGPDIRLQLLRENIQSLDALFLTHPHYDHAAGFDDLRPYAFTSGKKLAVTASEDTYKEMTRMRHYLIEELNGLSSSCFDFHILPSPFCKVKIAGIDVEVLSYSQMGMQVNGLRMGSIAYVSDIKEYTEELLRALQGVEILIVSAARYSGASMHFTLEEAIAFSEKVGAKNTYYTHMDHDIDYHNVKVSLPQHHYLAYDGLRLFF